MILHTRYWTLLALKREQQSVRALKQFEVTISVRNILSTRWIAQHDAAGGRGLKQQVYRMPHIHRESWHTNVRLMPLFQANCQKPMLEDHAQNLHDNQDYHRTVLQKLGEMDHLHMAQEHHFEYLCKLSCG